MRSAELRLMDELQDKVALVTGATSGIGRAAALRLAQAGAKVGALGRDDEDLQDVVKAIRNQGGKAIALDVDVSRPDQVKHATQEITSRWHRLDIVFANAGMNGVWAPIDELEPEEWNKTIAVNLSGTFYTIKYSIPALKERGGSIIVTSSVNGTRMFSNSGATAYACSKAGQVALTQMLALELAQHQIRVNVICPGMIETPIHQKTERRGLPHAATPVEFPEGNIPLTEGVPGSAEQVAELVLLSLIHI